MFGATSGPKDWPGPLYYLRKKGRKNWISCLLIIDGLVTQEILSRGGTFKLRNGPWTEGIKLMGLPDDADAK